MNQRTLPIILLNIVNGIGGTLLIPVLPFVVRDLGYGDAVFGRLAGDKEKWLRRKAELMAGKRWVELLY